LLPQYAHKPFLVGNDQAPGPAVGVDSRSFRKLKRQFALGRQFDHRQALACRSQSPHHDAGYRILIDAEHAKTQSLADLRLDRSNQSCCLGLCVRLGSDDNIRLTRVSARAHRGVRKRHQVRDQSVRCALTDATGSNDTALDHLVRTKPSTQQRKHLVLHQVPHLMRYTWKANDDLAVLLDRKAGRRPHRIVDNVRTHRQACLPVVVACHRRVPAPEHGPYLFQQ